MVWIPNNCKRHSAIFKRDLITFLNKKGVQTRPILSGNIDQQPVAKELNYKKQNLKNARLVNDNGFFIGNHHGIRKIERDSIIKYFEDFFTKMVSGSYLITGASGLLGSKVLEKLISKKINVQGIDKNLAKSHLRKKYIKM